MTTRNPAFLLFLALAFLSAAACRRPQTPPQSANSNDSQVEQPPPSEPSGGTVAAGETFHFRGRIGDKLYIEMTLNRDGENLTGTYLYARTGKDIQLKGAIDQGGALTLNESDSEGKPTGTFKGKWGNDTGQSPELGLATIEGKWSKPDGSKETKFNLTEQPVRFSSMARLVPKQISETKKGQYTIAAEYPQITGGDARFDKFNQEARGMITKDVNAFKASETASQTETETPPLADMPASDLEISYEIRYATDDLISVESNESAYSRGAAHPNNLTLALNYDLKNGKKLALADLFKPKSNYLGTISAYCIKDLKKQSKAKDSILSDEDIQKGAAARAENYKVWALTKKGFLITFDAYQVGPYAAGPQLVLVPYSALKDLINEEGPIGDLAKQ
jgi:hypothetical protein